MFLNQSALELITETVMDECDALDGVKNRLIENPLECRLDILNLACETSASDTKCLTAAQVGAAQAVCASPKDLQTGQKAYPGFPLGS